MVIPLLVNSYNQTNNSNLLVEQWITQKRQLAFSTQRVGPYGLHFGCGRYSEHQNQIELSWERVKSASSDWTLCSQCTVGSGVRKSFKEQQKIYDIPNHNKFKSTPSWKTSWTRQTLKRLENQRLQYIKEKSYVNKTSYLNEWKVPVWSSRWLQVNCNIDNVSKPL
jgi:hypothetical protein